MKIEEKYIKRCIEIAKIGLGSTAPPPSVGSVIVYNEKIIGEGYTSPYGGRHAEINAIASVKDKNLLSKSTLYVTLEPCSHYGKTPPCSDAIIKHGIKHIVIGCKDDNPQVSGKGIQQLKSAGCTVKLGVLEQECKELHKRFFTFHHKHRPYIILKWAETSDGFMAPITKNEKKPVWITNSLSRQLVHKWRSEEQAILVGTSTVSEDNPSLTVRDWAGNSPIRIVLDQHLRLSKTHHIFNDQAKTLIISGVDTDDTIYIDWTKKNAIAQQICDALYNRHINSVIIEGGSKTLQTFIDEGLWDEAREFIGTTVFKSGVPAPKITGRLLTEETIETDSLRYYTND